jgi:hypothetical protein
MLFSVNSFTATPSFSTRTISQHNHHAANVLYSSTSSNENTSSSSASASSASTTAVSTLQQKVNKLKKILEIEYTTFFNPMYTNYYAKDVTFTDPMTTLSGVQSYQNNVDMLASRTTLGKLLFTDASISLHSVTGGECDESNGGSIGDITTRWTLRLTVSILPWKPTARFTGISIYKVKPPNSSSNSDEVSVVNQIDYWDSVNIEPNTNGNYKSMDKGVAIKDFLDQLKPDGFQAQSAAPELPYQLLRRGDGYEVRKYPAAAGVKLPYKRRDEGFGSLGAFTKGMSPLSPALMDVQKDDTSDKYMLWPLVYEEPGSSYTIPQLALDKAGEGQWRTIRVVEIPARVVAVREFNDASMEPVVRKADRELREFLKRDGLTPEDGSEDLVQFAQYDAIFSMGRRRGETWITLAEDGHPW